jgi:hypothetical protein
VRDKAGRVRLSGPVDFLLLCFESGDHVVCVIRNYILLYPASLGFGQTLRLLPHVALDRAVVDRRLAPLGVREANLGLSVYGADALRAKVFLTWPTIQGAPSPTAWTWEVAPKPARTAHATTSALARRALQ